LQYVDIKNYIDKNDKIRNLFFNIEEIQKEQSFNDLISKFDKDFIKNINKIAEKKAKANNYIKDLDKIKINENKYLFYANKFFILDEQIFKLFKRFGLSWNYKYEYFCRDNRIFIIDQKYLKDTIEICKFNNHQELELEVDLILFYDNSTYKDDAIKSIKENGYNKFLEFLLFDGDYSSPIFDSSQRKIGYAYKIKDFNSNLDYTNYHINFKIGKMILLYLNDINMIQNFSYFQNNKNEFKEYFLINKNWINKYKKYYNYEELSKELQNNSLFLNVLNSLKNNSNDEKTNLSDKKLALIIKNIPEKIIKDFNEKDKNFEKYRETDDFKNEDKSIPLEVLHYYENGEQNGLLFFNNFEIINAQLYNILFAPMEMKVSYLKFGRRNSLYLNSNETLEKIKCMFNNNKIIIDLQNTKQDNKFRLEIGEFDNNKNFKPECFLIYNNENSLKKHVNFILNNGGFKKYSDNIKNMQTDTLEIKDGFENVG
jgi:hypothetical protein